MADILHHGSANAAYVFRPLKVNHIRLLHLDNNEKPLQAHFTELDVSSSVAYRALSHTWTPRRLRASLPMRLWLDQEYIELDDNVAAFLLAQDSSQMNLPIWIDAICIDQTNATEKMQQLPMMGRIYADAGHCVIWLGGAHEIIESALAAVSEVNAALSEYNIDPKTSHLSLNRAMPTSLIQNQEGLCDIVTRTWFQRLWTMQEFVLAKEVVIMCGKTTISGEVFDRFVELFNLCNYQANEALMKPEMYVMMFCEGSSRHLAVEDAKDFNAFVRFPALQALRKATQENRRTSSMALAPAAALHYDLTTLVTTFEKRATVSEDSILGLLGMLRLSDFQRIPISISTTAIDVFIAATKIVMQQHYNFNNLSLLHYTDTIERLPGLPSWVPNFHSSQRLHTLSPLSMPGHYLYGASLGGVDFAKERVRFSHPDQDNSSLVAEIKGRLADRVVAVINGEGTGWQNAEYVSFAGEAQEAWERRCNDLARSHARGKFRTFVDSRGSVQKEVINKAFKDYLKCYRTTLAAGSVRVGKSHKRSDPSDKTYKEFVWRLSRLADPSYNDYYTRMHEPEHPGVSVNWEWLTGKDKDISKPLYIGEEKEEYHARVFEVCRKRSFFVTEEGRLGIGGRAVEGDKVVLFEGARTPFLFAT